MREEASFNMFLEKDDPELPCKRKVLSNYEEGKTPVELLSKVEEYYRQFFIKQLIWLSSVFEIDFSRKIILKLFRKYKWYS